MRAGAHPLPAFASAVVLALLLGACVYAIDSAIPDSMQTFEPRLVGTWTTGSDTATIARGGNSGYRIFWKNTEGDSLRMHGRLGRLGDHDVLELVPSFGLDDDGAGGWPIGRLLLVVNVGADESRAWLLEKDSLRAAAAGRSGSIPFISQDNDVVNDLILTARTAELVPALREHLRRPGVLAEEQLWRRVK